GDHIAGPAVTIIPQDKRSEASAALAVLGYSQAEINTALKGIDTDALPLDQIIRLALKNMLKN
ncbi:MAG: Holliday junction branch migration protein RuvA, partial [Oscillospiraceae bacterium]|nr:Holliday junction branch migration protein RuvA [Oscillospiraceae bacterium]